MYRDATSAKEVADRMLSTLESRREQITNRSTICLAATSGLLVLAVQLIIEICEMDDYAKYNWLGVPLSISVIICSCSVVKSLDLIKKISRERHMGIGQRASDPNIFYFGWIMEHDEKKLELILRNMSLKQQMEFEVRQAISLSKNLDYRYRQLNQTYLLFVISLSIYVATIIGYWIVRQDIIGLLQNFFSTWK